MATLFAKRVRCEIDAGSYAPFRDRLTGNSPELWQGNDARFEIGAFIALANAEPAAANVVDLTTSGITSMSLEVRATPEIYVLAGATTNGSPTVTLATTAGLTAGMTVTGTGIPAATTILAVASATTLTLSANATATGAPTLTFGAPNVMEQTIALFDNTMTAETWLDLTKQHAVFEFTDSETNLTAGSYHLAVSVLTSIGKSITLGTTTLRIRADGAGGDAGTPPNNPGAALSVNAADLRYLRFLPSVTGPTGGGATKLDGVVTVGITVPQLFAFVAGTAGTGQAEEHWLLRAATSAAEAEDGVTTVRPDDWNSGTNTKIFVRVL